MNVTGKEIENLLKDAKFKSNTGTYCALNRMTTAIEKYIFDKYDRELSGYWNNFDDEEDIKEISFSPIDEEDIDRRVFHFKYNFPNNNLSDFVYNPLKTRRIHDMFFEKSRERFVKIIDFNFLPKEMLENNNFIEKNKKSVFFDFKTKKVFCLSGWKDEFRRLVYCLYNVEILDEKEYRGSEILMLCDYYVIKHFYDANLEK